MEIQVLLQHVGCATVNEPLKHPASPRLDVPVVMQSGEKRALLNAAYGGGGSSTDVASQETSPPRPGWRGRALKPGQMSQIRHLAALLATASGVVRSLVSRRGCSGAVTIMTMIFMGAVLITDEAGDIKERKSCRCMNYGVVRMTGSQL